MRRRRLIAALGVAAALPFAAAGAADPAPPAARAPQTAVGSPRTAAGTGQCGVCHPDVRVAFERGVHPHEGVACTDCHGGNPRTLVVAEAHRGSFVARPARRDVPKLCASCHADVARMRPYNLATDQYALYQTSRHGGLLAGGDSRVAVCTDCHGAHDILAPDDPASRVARRNIPATCGRCHGDRKLMGAYGTKDDPYADYMKSVHAAALIEGGNRRAPECSSCHGVHGVAPPGVGDVNKVCGNCHEPTRRYFQASPHAEGLKQAGLPECAACHQNHAIARTSAAMLGSLCEGCHAPGGKEVQLGRSMLDLYTGAQGEIERAADLVVRAEAIPIDVEDYRARLEEARTYLTEALPAAHTLSVEEVERFTRRSRSIAIEVGSEIDEKFHDLRLRKLGLVVFWFYALLTVAVLSAARRARQRGTTS